MRLEFTQEQLMIRDMVRDFVQTELKPVISNLESKEEFPAVITSKMGELGLLGMTAPEKYGGSGLDSISYALAIEEIAKVSASVAITVSVTNSVCVYPIYRFGTEEQKERYLRPLASGKMIGGFALTEPGAGSDAANVRCRAEKQGEQYILNGTKAWVTNAIVGEIFVVLASMDPSRREAISAFIVERNFKGFSFGKVEDKMGLRCSKTADIVLEDCKVPAENLLGKEGDGLRIALHSLDGSRISVGAQAVGIAQAALDEANFYARQREAFGRPIAELQAIQFMLADMATRIEAARLLVMHASMLREANVQSFTKEASMAKLFASETACHVASMALQIHGAYGYSKEYSVERYFRDARVTTIYEGTSEIQRLIIARRLLA
ncbi:MAG: acyl-CoA dehydrogenase family protein [Acidobacteriota bacterium]